MVEEAKNRWAHSRHAEYNSSEIDKIRYCQPSRWTEKGGPTASLLSV